MCSTTHVFLCKQFSCLLSLSDKLLKTMYTLRPYQQEAVDAGVELLNRKHKKNKRNSGLIVAPSGSGKSILIANIGLQAKGNTLVFSPTKEILEQNFEKMIAYDPFIDAKVFSASMNKKEIGKITFATIGSAINKKELFGHFDNILVDEIHICSPHDSMYKRMFEFIGDKNYVGLTATPYRFSYDGYGGAMFKFLTRTNPKIMKEVIAYTQMQDLKKDGFLSDLEYYQIGGFDTKKLTKNSTLSDYTDESARQYYLEIGFEEKVANVVMRLINAGRKHILVFTRFVKEAQALKNLLGDKCEWVSGETPKQERESIIKRFKTGEVKVVTNVNCLSVGFDFPELDCVLIAKEIMSLSLYYQTVCRGIRKHISKKSCWIVDMCGAYNRFGKVEDLVLANDGGNQWYYHNGKQRLTNVYLQ